MQAKKDTGECDSLGYYTFGFDIPLGFLGNNQYKRLDQASLP